jgi:hypothetical protein
MAGKYNGVHADVLQKNEFARFVPCAAYNVNVAYENAASLNNANLANFFFKTHQPLGNDTHYRRLLRVIQKHAGLKQVAAIKALHSQITEVFKVLSQICR